MIKILIVEDEKPISDLIRLSLGKSGYDCDCAFDGMSAADMLDENIYDLVLLDIMLPEVDGFELLEYIKPLCIPVIFITAKGSVNDRVRDNGPGIPPEAIEHLTEAFYRVDKSRSRAQGGAGLGLALCSDIARLHNGSIEFESSRETGTCVTVYLNGGAK